MSHPDTHVTDTAEQLWAALDRAKAGQQSRTVAPVEDALFRYYLPMARAMTTRLDPDHPNRDDTAQAAEVGLAQAILGWRRRNPDGFDRFARSTITTQLRRHHHQVRTFRGGQETRPPPAGSARP
jgi:DNA-directed RNA polymerase specialized sigma subunit